MALPVAIPPEFLPDDNQYPPFVITPEQRQRFDLCFALTRLIAQRDDPVFCRQLYFSDLATGDLEASAEGEPGQQKFRF